MNPKDNRPARQATINAVKQLYCALFDQVSHQYWTKLLPADKMIKALKECCLRLDYKSHAEGLESQQEMIIDAFSNYDEKTFNFLDYIRMLKPLLSVLPVSMVSFPARAALAHMHEHIGNDVSTEDLMLLKGLASHIAEGQNPWSEAARDLACNWLRPDYKIGMMVVNITTGDVGVITATQKEMFSWRSYTGDSDILETDKRIVLPFEPRLIGTRLYANDIIELIDPKSIIAEFEAAYPQGKTPAPGSVPLSLAAIRMADKAGHLPPRRQI